MIITEKKESYDFLKENSTDFSSKNSSCDIIGNMEVSKETLPVTTDFSTKKNSTGKKKSLNPKGLPESAQHRNRLGKAFIARMRADFQKHGIATIERLREKNPGHYLQLIANLIPNQVELNVNHTFMDLLREASEYHNNKNSNDFLSENSNIIDVEVITKENSNEG